MASGKGNMVAVARSWARRSLSTTILSRFLASPSPDSQGSTRNMIGDHNPIEFDVHQSLHDLAHVVIAVIDHGLGEMRQGCAHVAEVYLEELLHAAEILDHLHRVLAGHRAALQPRSTAQAHADVRTVRDL